MVLRQQTGIEEKLSGPSLRHHALLRTPPPLFPAFSRTNFPLFSPVPLFVALVALPFSLSPSNFLLSPHSSLFALPPQIVGLAVCCPTIGYSQSSIASPLHPRPRHSSTGGATEPCPPITLGAQGYNTSLRAGSCQLVITAEKETHTRVHKHIHTAPLAPSLIRGPSPSNGPE